MIDRNIRHTLSAVAWVGAFLCGLALATSAMALANASPTAAVADTGHTNQ